ncbi:hypothetical protein [Streptomyces yokosukanensis]|uniref:hypothetical protein n=1 Tax=Streptomyces yokosukanensis TaxID=67386 RepID=UPI001ABFB8A2
MAPSASRTWEAALDRHSGVRPYTPPRELIPLWRDEFDAAHSEGGLFQLTMHPHIIGHRSRIVVLEELLDHISARGDVWYATHAQVARYVWQKASGNGTIP